MKHVFLGRFAPFHDGHKILLAKLVNKFGLKNSLVIIGTSNIIDARTPFNPKVREGNIKKFFPKIKTLFLPDLKSDKKWLQSLKNIEKKLNSEFIFYGGSIDDLKILSKAFKTIVLVDRKTEGLGITATEIRGNLISLGLLTTLNKETTITSMLNNRLTKSGLDELKKELTLLVSGKRPKLVDRLANARSQGDLSENADYQSAKEELEMLDGRIDELSEVIKNAVIVEEKNTKITVKLNGKEIVFNIVGEWEADPMNKKISDKSPLGMALNGKKKGDKVEVEAPAGKIVYEILKVE